MKPEGATGHLGLTEVYRHCCWLAGISSLAAHTFIFLILLSQAWRVVGSPGWLPELSEPSDVKGSLTLLWPIPTPHPQPHPCLMGADSAFVIGQTQA